MLARMLILALVSAVVAVMAGMALGLPVWALFLLYALSGALALLVGGAIAAVAGQDHPAVPSYAEAPVKQIPLRH
ncbi:hypothetical protein [Tabrizicola sp.]|uniref:hypothetical protein n=1 Tax=Tabrizicola sp. TaxID=2005166 RepID=UPI0035B1BE28